jgi:hypothetical protein
MGLRFLKWAVERMISYWMRWKKEELVGPNRTLEVRVAMNKGK